MTVVFNCECDKHYRAFLSKMTDFELNYPKIFRCHAGYTDLLEELGMLLLRDADTRPHLQ